ncbi:X2-like carbohydrate binding domain-containing protein [Anaeromicropila herbilytica]|uniref:CBM3 domain-containing protein n=1 Tax=Anaeromicropila herbilytica TaxID=2785025 RepID=A0A7R7EKR5_9FIRM|nr:X2-like carbohydrate binding domain-containing protein [Anaeromicropila herbilytica]BCN30630.1 hypothetical protein bsdtb5_19250 [Anaeromicropila herbilytica]
MKVKRGKRLLSILLTMTLFTYIPNNTIVNAQNETGTTSTSTVATENYSWKNVQIGGGGYVDDVIFNNGEKDLIYARTDMGGAYRWDKTTNTWIPLTDWIGNDDWNNLGCDSLATDPVDTNRVYIQAGTYTNNWTDANGCILRSTDKGDTWQITKLPFKVGANMLGRSMGERLVVDPNSNNVLYMGTRSGNGLWKSTDYGVTWNKVTSFTEVGDYIPSDFDNTSYDNTITGVVWVTFDTTSSTKGTPCQKIYVGVANKAKSGAAAENTVFCSEDGGKTWSALGGQPQNGYLPQHGVLSSNGNLYITYSNGPGPYVGTKGEVWKYNTTKKAWTQISPVASSSEDDYFGYGGISVDAQHPDTILVSTFNSWWPEANFFYSTDGGTTWTRFWDWNGYPSRTLRYTQDISATPWLTFNKIAEPPIPSPVLGWMIGNVSIDPFNSDRMFYGTGATVYGTDNLTDLGKGGKVNITVKSLGIEQTAVQSLISPTTGTAHLISGLGDVCGFVHEDLTKVPKTMMGSPTFSTTTGMDYAELSPSKFVRVGNTDKGDHPRIALSYDAGKNWYSVKNCWSSSSTDETGGGNVAMSADGNSIVWAPNGTDQPVCYSSSSGNSWNQSKGIPSHATIASDRVNPKKFYAFYNGTFYVSTDGGANFTATVSTGLPTASNASLKAMPGVEGDIWLAGGYKDYEYGLWHSTDSGKTFTKLSNVQEADVIGFGKAAPGQSYMALYTSAKINGVRGIFRSDDCGASWVRINDDQHQYGRLNSCITGDPRIYGRVYVGTNGRGIVYGDTTSTVTSSIVSPLTASFDKNVAEQKDVTVEMTLNGNTLVSISNGTNQLVSGTDYMVLNNTVTIKKEYLAQQANGTTNLTFDFSAGVDPVLAISITDSSSQVNSTVSPSAISFDKNVAMQSDVIVDVALNGNTLTAIKNGSSILTLNTDYTISDNKVIIKKDYLSSLAVGVTNLTFDFSAGKDQVVTVTVTDSTVVVVGNLEIQMYNSGTSDSSNTLSPLFKIINTGSTSINLSDVTLRYYFTADGASAHSFWCDWSSVGTSNVQGAFITMKNSSSTADTYLEIGFTSGAGTIAAGQSAFVQTRISKADWSSYSQANDYSFSALNKTYASWNKVTAYINGSLQWGIEP